MTMGTAKKKYPVNAKDYKLYEEIGEGVSASVYRALCVPLNEIVAIKVLDLEKCNNDLDGIRREVHTMSLINHPNLLQSYCSFTTGHNLWVVMPYMSCGSCLHIMKSSFPDGFEEPVIATFLREVLKALVYLHAHGHIHRDVKAGNILVDFNGSIKLADFGVSACMFDAGDRQRSRNTFVGTPCWTAPEVMQQLHGYDFKADIWSFGITTLKLAHGHAPFSKYPPMKVLLMTLQNAPPGLDYERDKKFSKSFKDMVSACLVKDPKKRPSSEKLLKHSFFKQAKNADYLERSILDGLSPLGDRFRILKAKEADLLVQNKELYEDMEQLSQQEYIRGISAWKFNLDDIKNQAALINDNDEISNIEKPKLSNQQNGIDNNHLDAKAQDTADEIVQECFDICEADVATASPIEQPPAQLSLKASDQLTDKDEIKQLGQIKLQKTTISGPRKFMSGSLLPDNVIYPKKFVSNGERDPHLLKFQVDCSSSGPLQHIQRINMSNSLSVENLSEGVVVQQKGRFRVTEADMSPRAPIITPTSAVPSALLLPSLHHNTIQREEILQLIKFAEQNHGSSSGNAVETGNSDFSQIPPTPREKELQPQVIQLQQSVGSLVEELQKQKMKNVQLEKEVSEVKKNSIKG
ncbi:uncharacterized protein LOC143594154 [Bidens hawaiensis]|uniref:uncharacterized protein LOC143594154 n=1 Tax=Bidens hawaiensis TaxID=980011 RepID=UPI00404A7908